MVLGIFQKRLLGEGGVEVGHKWLRCQITAYPINAATAALNGGFQKRSELKQDHSQTLGCREQNQTTQRLGERKLVWPGKWDLQDPARKFGLRSHLCAEQMINSSQ